MPEADDQPDDASVGSGEPAEWGESWDSDDSLPRSPRHGSGRRIVAVVVIVALLAGAVGVALLVAFGSDDAEGSAGVPHFVDDTVASGIDHRYTGAFEHFVGGGAAAFDCNGDSLDELYLAGGTSPAALYRNTSGSVTEPLSFTVVPSATTDLVDVTGAYPLDIDADRNMDLVVLRRGSGNVVLRGLGDCRFEDATAALGIDGGDEWTVAFSATWEGDNALPTLAFGNYLTLDRSACADSELLRPAGPTVADGYAAPIALSPGYCTLSILFSDWSGTGERDLRMTNDRHYYRDGQDQLWRIRAGDEPRQYTQAEGWQRLQIWGMGIASHDVTGDGLPEVFLTSQADNKLQTLADGPAQPTYTDMALASGVTAQRPYTGGDVLPSTAWHAQFEDVNNDAITDLFVTKGNVEAQVDFAAKDPNNLLIGQQDGTFIEGAEEAGIVTFDRGRGAVIDDFNNDGMLDIVTVNREAPVRVWRNVGSGTADAPAAMGHWLDYRLQQDGPNRDAVGAVVEVRTGDGDSARIDTREVTVGGGHASGQAGSIHVGLGDSVDAEIRVRWPDGTQGRWIHIPEGQGSIVIRPES